MELTYRVSPSMTLQRMSYSRHPEATMGFYGNVHTQDGSEDRVVSQFLDSLNQSPFFDSSTLESRIGSDHEQQALLEFSIRTSLVPLDDD